MTDSNPGDSGGQKKKQYTVPDIKLAALTITIQGEVLHRLRFPKSDSDNNVITAQNRFSDGSIPVSGKVQVQAWSKLEEDEKEIDSKPDKETETGEKGEFKLEEVPLIAKKKLHFVFTYHNADAQLKEINTIEVKIDDLLKAKDSLTGSSAATPIEDDKIQRSTKCYFRFGPPPLMEWDLKQENPSRGATLRKTTSEDNQTETITLRFIGNDAVLINAFCLQAPLINQNLLTVNLNADVPSGEITDRYNDLLGENKIDEAHNPTANLPSNNKTTIPFKGYVICCPTSTAMALGCLSTNVTVQDLCQEVYNETKKTELQHPSDFQPNELKSLWPYEKTGPRDWLATTQGGDFRPWQWAWRVANYLKKKHNLTVQTHENMDLFDSSNQAPFFRSLGAGNPGIVSIDHSAKDRGHVLCLLGTILDYAGDAIRLIFNDPYGDLSREPGELGYSGKDLNTNVSYSKIDKKGEKWGAYVPYGKGINAVNGTIYTKWWIEIKGTCKNADEVQKRLLPSEAAPGKDAGDYPQPSQTDSSDSSLA